MASADSIISEFVGRGCWCQQCDSYSATANGKRESKSWYRMFNDLSYPS